MAKTVAIRHWIDGFFDIRTKCGHPRIGLGVALTKAHVTCKTCLRLLAKEKQ